MLKKILRRQKFYKHKHWLWSTLLVMIITLPVLLFFGQSHASADCGNYNGNFLHGYQCQYSPDCQNTGGGVDCLRLNSGGSSNIGTSGSPDSVQAGSTVSLTVGYHSNESSGGQNVVGWLNMSSPNPSDYSVTAGGDPNYVFSSGCFVEVAQIPGNAGTGANPYGRDDWRTNSTGTSGVFACGSLENKQPRTYLSANYPGYFATNYNNSDSTVQDGSAVGSSVVWSNGTSQSANDTLSIKFSPAITAPEQICMRYHVSITANPGVNGDIASGFASGIASNDLSDISGVIGNNGSSASACFLVQPLPIKSPPPTCSFVAIASPGASKQVLVRVEDSNNNVLIPSGNSNPSTTAPQTSNYNGDGTEPSWVGTPFFIVGSTKGGTWLYTVNAQNVRVVIIDRTDSGGVWTTTSYSDTTINCYNITINGGPGGACQMAVDGNVPNGPGNAVEAGSTFYVDVTVMNNGPGDAPASLAGDPLQVDPGTWNYNAPGSTASTPNFASVSTGAIPFGQSVSVRLTFTAPSGVASDTIWAHPAYSNLFNFGAGTDCSKVVNVYQPFTLKSSAAASFVGDPENPTAVNYSTSVTNNSATPPPQVPVQATDTSRFYFTASQSGGQTDLVPSFTDTQNYGNKTELSGTYTIPIVRPGLSQVTAGDTYCADISLGYTAGWVGPGGPTDVTDTSGAGTTTSNPCAVVVNKPYFKVYGNGAAAGGSFSGPVNGVLADWNNDSGLYPAPVNYDYGGGSELANIATGPTVGYASGQQSANDLSPAPRISFANTSNISNGQYTPAIGGYSGVTPQLLTQQGLLNPTPWGSGGSTDTAAPLTGNYTTPPNTNLVLNAASIANGQSVYLNVNGNVYINGPITYWGANNDTWTTGNIPSFILNVTGGNIYIAPGIGELDGLYVAEPSSGNGGTIYTCGQDSGGVFSAMSAGSLYTGCNHQLTVYGSFEAQSVHLMRTYGSLRDETPIAASTTTRPGPNTDTSVAFDRYYCGNDNGSSLGIHFYYNTGNGLPFPPPAGCSSEADNPGGLGYILPAPLPAAQGYCDTPGAIPLWWAQDPTDAGDNFYTTDSAVEPHTTVVGCVPASAGSNTEVVYRLYDTLHGGHFYTIDPSEASVVATWPNTILEGPAFNVYNNSGQGGAATTITVSNAASPPSPLSCSNNGGATPNPTLSRATCAAEIFDYSPEYSLSPPNTSGGSHSATSAIEIYNLPPVL
ncbi:MAG TPA: hypothetical protein VNG32_01265 [Candidatus Dormibacteraeota bacterium]|nr:hypothetical protein [Candidatus Dormibacteraeota bacterium]